jgi:hypothetical protein
MDSQRSSSLNEFLGWLYVAAFLYLIYFCRIDWSHLAPIALGAFTICLAVDAIQVAFGFANKEGLTVLSRVRWELMALCLSGALVALWFVVGEVRENGWGAHDRTALDIATGLCVGALRYFFRLRFWRPASRLEGRGNAS